MIRPAAVWTSRLVYSAHKYNLFLRLRKRPPFLLPGWSQAVLEAEIMNQYHRVPCRRGSRLPAYGGQVPHRMSRVLSTSDAGGNGMRKAFVYLFFVVAAFIVILPAVLVRGCHNQAARPRDGIQVQLFEVASKKVTSMLLEDYLVGVVAAEMPARFQPEALKAQAVAARTFTVKRLRRYGGAGSRYHSGADLSDDPAEGQAWLSPKQLKRKWGLSYGANLNKVTRAIRDTEGLIATFQGKPIEAIYHSTCGGTTEAAVQVWGRPIPYLISVSCGYDRQSPHYRTTVRIPIAQAARLLHVEVTNSQVRTASATGRPLFKVLSQTHTGRARQIQFAGATFDGERFRQALKLGSPRFRYAVSQDDLILTTIGYGHGVGLCQYGAEGLAKAGASFNRILGHYFPGTSLARIVNKSSR